MSYPGQDPNQQGQYPNSGQYGGGYNPQPQPTDPYSGQQYGQQPTGYGQQPPYEQQPGQQLPYGQQPPYGQQQPPYGQQQAPYGQQQYQQPLGGQNGPTSSGLSQNTAAGLSYLIFWVTGIVFFVIEKQNRFVRFHAFQAILYSAVLTIFFIIERIIGSILPYGLISGAFGCAVILVLLAFFSGWLLCVINAFQGKFFKLPYIGDIAERYVDTGVFKLQ